MTRCSGRWRRAGRGGTRFERALKVGAGAGAANFLRRGLGNASREVVQELADRVMLEPFTEAG